MQKGTDIILVTGSTGNQGGAVARQLLARGHKVRALTRRPESASAQALAALGAEVVQADFDDPASLERAASGVWGAFAVQNTWEAGVAHEEKQGIVFAEICKDRGVLHFVYTSVASADRATGIPHFDNKWRIEEAVRRMDFSSYAVLRPVFFMENLISPWFKPGLDEGKLMIGVKPKTALQMIAVEDIGRWGCFAFERHAQVNGQAIAIAGDQLTMPAAADILSDVAGRRITFVQVPLAEVRKFSDDFATMLDWFDRVGYDVDIPAVAAKSGIQPLRFREWAARQSWV